MFIPFFNYSQEVSFLSKSLSSNRNVNISLPIGYNDSISYPCLYVLDGDKLGSLATGIVRFNKSFDLYPGMIVISIDQEKLRWTDCGYDNHGNLNSNSKIFYNFISSELIPYIDINYSTNNYKIVLGHSFTANFINYFFIDERDIIFDSFIAISPYFAPNLIRKIEDKAKRLNSRVSYYISYSENDLSGHINSVRRGDKILRTIKNSNFNYKLDYIKRESHISMVPFSLPHSLEFIYTSSKPIFKLYKLKKLKKLKGSYIDFVINHYSNMELFYNLNMEYRLEDLEYVSFAVSRYSDKEELKEFGEFCIENKPKSYIGYYLLGEYYEKMSEIDKALLSYTEGYLNLGDDCFNKSDFHNVIDKLLLLKNKK